MDTASERALAEVEGLGVRFVHLWFTDVLGFLKSVAIPSEELEKAFREGIGFDGSAIQGFARLQESDMLMVPDAATFGLLRGGEDPVVRMFCDIVEPDGTPFAGDPRQVLRRGLAAARDLGYEVVSAPEVEFFLSASDRRLEPLDRGGYFDLAPAARTDAVRKRAIVALEELGIHVVQAHHEDAPSQHEFDLPPDDPLRTADAVATLRLVTKEAARAGGLHASFMPKPVAGRQGSGMHVFLGLREGDRDALHDPTDAAGLSKTGRSFVAGLLEHAPALTAITNQWVNSYKRLVPGYEAPVSICWGRRNPSALVRVPAEDPGPTRVEYRAPDPACNPYLTLAVLIGAGLDGVRRELAPPPELNEDAASLSPEELRAAGVGRLPEDLHDAVAAMERSDLVAEILGGHVFEWFLRNKREEWDAYRTEVTAFEMDRSFPIL